MNAVVDVERLVGAAWISRRPHRGPRQQAGVGHLQQLVAGAGPAREAQRQALFRWSELWPKIAGWFGLDTAPPLPMSLEVVMADKAPLWDAMVERHRLQRIPYQDVSSWRFGDFVFSWDYDLFADGSKARRFGFHEFVETEAMFLALFEDFRRRRIIP